MQLSQSVTYALRAALQLAEVADGAPVSRAHLASQGGMPERFLHSILRDLVKHRILRSVRGGGGGFSLARRTEEITLLDVIEAVDGPAPVGLPAAGFDAEPAGRLRDVLERVTEDTRRRLAAVTLAHLLPAAAHSTRVALATCRPDDTPIGECATV